MKIEYFNKKTNCSQSVEGSILNLFYFTLINHNYFKF